MKDFLAVVDLSVDEIKQILEESAKMKKRLRLGIPDLLYQGKTLGMYFEKPSLRTRVSLETAMNSLGGSSICLEAKAPGALWERECVKDQARVMSRFVHLISMRTFSHEVIEEFARESTVPVVNVLSDFSHPTQALADFLTFQEHFGDLAGKTMTFMGDGNNVSRSLLAAAALTGVRFIWSGPPDYRLDQPFVKKVLAKHPKTVFLEETDPFKAVAEADIIYTDVWASMGQEEEGAKREIAFKPYQVNDQLLAKAPARAKVMHCLPAHRGLEITDAVMDGSKAIVYDQAENRMHIYRGLFSLWAGTWNTGK